MQTANPLLKIARNMLATAKKITHLLNWGSFVHLTLQIPEGNIIIAPYHENYICLLTTRTINIGHIRRILRDLQQSEAPQNTLHEVFKALWSYYTDIRPSGFFNEGKHPIFLIKMCTNP